MPDPKEEEIKTLKWLLERLKMAEDYCDPFFERGKRYYQLYRFGSSVKEEDWPYVNRTRSRDILAFVEDTTGLMVQTLFATMPFFSVIPRQTSMMRMQYEGIDPAKIGKQMEACLDYQISHEDTEFFEEIVDYFKNGGIFGNSYIGVFPKFDYDGTYQRPMFKDAGYWDILPIPGGNRITRTKGVFYREFINQDDLNDAIKKKIYKPVDVKEEMNRDAKTKWHDELLEEIGIKNYVPDWKDIEVFHYFSGGHVISFANRKVILRDSTLPQDTGQIGEDGQPVSQIMKPFPYDQPIVQYKYMPLPGEFFAMGIPEVLEVLQEDKNLVRSARRDNIDLTINKIMKARAGADINYDLIKYYAGAIWPMENLTDLEEVDIQDVSQSSYLEEDKIRFDMENALSFFGYARGMTPQHTERPTTVMKLQQASMNRQDLAIKLAEFGVLQKIAMRVILLTRRYMKPSDYEAIIGDQDAGFFRMTEDHVRRFYYIKPVGSSVTHIREIRQQQIQFAIQMLASARPDMMQNPFEPFAINWYQALRESLETSDIKNIDRILIPLQQQQQQMGMGGMMGGMGMGMPNPMEMAQLMQIGYGGQQ